MQNDHHAETTKTSLTQILPPGFFPGAKPPEEPKPSLFTVLRNRILTGLFIVIPAVITLLIAFYFYSKLTEWAVDLVKLIPWAKDLPLDTFWYAQGIRVVSLLFMLTALAFIGQLAKMALGKKLISIAQTLILKVPLVSSIYSTTQQIGDALWSPKGGMFRQVVLFEFPMQGIWSVGFLTNEYKDGFEIKDKLGGKELISVFMPTTPNPTSGFLMMIPKDKCIFLKMEIAEAMRFIISGGAVVPSDLPQEKPSANPPTTKTATDIPPQR